jgi:guanosine-3',5'-bis(diphosphate) 3'-pyrophosphohydrolase
MPVETQLDVILSATRFAIEKHRGQVRKDQRGSPYVTHPLTVAQLLWEIGGVRATDTLTAAILHDTLEDTPTSKEELRQGFGEQVLLIVLEVTDDKSLPKLERKRRQVRHAPVLSDPAKLIKFGDKLANCHDILESPPADWDLARRRNYVQWAADVLFTIRGVNPPLESAFDAVLREAEKQLRFTIQPFQTLSQRPWGWPE